MKTRRAFAAAVLLWTLLAVVVWNVVFDRMIVVSGREYVRNAALAERAGRYLLIDEVMRPAAARALRLASASAGGVLLVGGALIWWAARRGTRADSNAG
ncbi:MAG: hypothetical protein AB7Q29_05280 [Vicinamibacterales bacterium]